MRRVEPGKQQKSSEKAPYVCFPCYRLIAACYRQRAHSEQSVDPEPHGKEQHDTCVGQDAAQRNTRHAIGARGGWSEEPRRATTQKSKTHRGRHRARDGRRRTDHGKLLACVRRKMQSGPRRCGYGKKCQKAERSEAACNCAPERQK